jgi:secondary thiamine-phosphate synthase enzyme
MPGRLTSIRQAAIAVVATATLTVDTNGRGLVEITQEAQRFVTGAGAAEGTLLLFVRHTSASLVIQENADPDVRTVAALDRLAPVDAGWVHAVEGPDPTTCPRMSRPCSPACRSPCR